MEEESRLCCCCRCGREAGSHRHHGSIQLLQRRERRQARMVHFLTALLLLMTAALAVLGTVVVLGGRGQQLTMQPSDRSPEARFEKQQQKKVENPSAMLTAPVGNIVRAGFLEWESATGNAFCRGGMSYSNGSLIVPQDGIYQVFLQITYESKDELKCGLGGRHSLINKVFLFEDNYNTNVVILSSVDSVNCSVTNQWKKSLYTAGLFKLQANSKLRVTSSIPELILKNEHEMFFGAELRHQ